MTEHGHPPFKLDALDHVVLLVSDLQRTLDFYCDCLGAKVERRLDKIALVQLRAGDSLIDLIAYSTPEGAWAKSQVAGGGRNMEHFCLRIAPFDDAAIRGYLAKHEIAIADSSERYGAKGTGPSIYIKDADGNTVELKGPPKTDPAKPPHRIITTKRLTLRPIRFSDAEDLFAWCFSDEETMRYWSEPAHKEIDQTRAFVARAVGPTDQNCVWVITLGDDRAIGFISLYGRREKIIGLGYMLAREHRGKGFVTEAANAGLVFAFDDWQMHKVRADLDPRNLASAAVVERLGFTKEGVLRQDFIYNGDYVDAANYGLLRSEWIERR